MGMNQSDFKDLLDKYYEGDTSADDERTLRAELNSGTGKINDVERLFFDIAEKSKLRVSDNFEDMLASRIDKLAKIDHGHQFNVSFLWKMAATFLIVCILAYWGLTSLKPVTHLITTTDETVAIELPDGSKVWLNKNSSVKYSDNFDKQRNIEFSGEGFFDITHDPLRPFTISTANTTTRVLGTSFSIRSYDHERSVEVIVVTGSVSFSEPEHDERKTVLNKDGRVRYDIQKHNIDTSTVSDQNLIAWKTKKLQFDDALVGDVIDDLERYSGNQIEVDNDNILKCHFRGSFDNVGIEKILSTLSYSLDITCKRSGETFILTGEGCSSN
jgi:ferric-dicitrate binding protein FerR (iron transport regulator)